MMSDQLCVWSDTMNKNLQFLFSHAQLQISSLTIKKLATRTAIATIIIRILA